MVVNAAPPSNAPPASAAEHYCLLDALLQFHFETLGSAALSFGLYS
jgi:hypothetical protein